MANGHDKADWTVELKPFGGGAGSVHYGNIRGGFAGETLTGRVQIVWKGTRWPEGIDAAKASEAALEAVKDALKRRC